MRYSLVPFELIAVVESRNFCNFFQAKQVLKEVVSNTSKTDFLYKIVELPNHLVVDYKQAIFSSLAKTRSDC